MWRQPAPVGQRRGEGQEDQVAAGHERVGQALRVHLDRDVAGQRGVGNRARARRGRAHGPAQPAAHSGLIAASARAERARCIEFDAMALAIVEADRLDVLETLQRPGQAGGGILPAGKQHQGHEIPPAHSAYTVAPPASMTAVVDGAHSAVGQPLRARLFYAARSGVSQPIERRALPIFPPAHYLAGRSRTTRLRD